MLAKILNGRIVYQMRGFVSQPFQKWFDDVMAAVLKAPNAMDLCPNVEVQVCKIHCVSKAPPRLTINVEDAATSEAEIYKALELPIC
ncbi:hypothetical protein HanXRQr2_Chr06g0241361 [Helianthus annuus]|uniref:Uncharacterized protein n=1 Tax=Helianthus annuus TaxID=4232 RepID=A0A9K3IQI3_HELAN|nr:hypothetical protein HanXRQr2_Chr06g0241361 [Helianthus annuus]KAJ0559224.1 hypothetical protein HanHA300_Chr06g0197971 [Helianthus annuus]KAJ0572162.1 hypothetical protein HanHA89_Chr06g0212751 [Helianthus annuus]KAJ0736629.1 hypothetical protein HanLR1_Chr06g0198031 [Helianthus annuus]KAJ0913933.1 hypothetical protein HanPSC8_Chr06g0232921 [Helianthus annuus]